MTKAADTGAVMATLRPVDQIPPLPDEATAIVECKAVSMAQARMDDSRLVFSDGNQWDKVFHDGFFLLRIPKGMDFFAGDRFVERFYQPKDDDALGYRSVTFNERYQGYFDRPHDQWENFYVERRNWGAIPQEVAQLGHQMAELGVMVLSNVLQRLDIAENHWEEITGGLTSGGGHRMLAFNHFRSQIRARGCKMHRDSGWVTILRSYERGLLAFIDDQLRSINPIDDHVIVNFGSSLEVLTGIMPTPVRANVHGVAQTVEREHTGDRHSYAMFLDSNLDSTIYQMNDKTPRAVQSVAEFAEQEVARTYDADDAHV
jgi:hypothetical protein